MVRFTIGCRCIAVYYLCVFIVGVLSVFSCNNSSTLLVTQSDLPEKDDIFHAPEADIIPDVSDMEEVQDEDTASFRQDGSVDVHNDSDALSSCGFPDIDSRWIYSEESWKEIETTGGMPEIDFPAEEIIKSLLNGDPPPVTFFPEKEAHCSVLTIPVETTRDSFYRNGVLISHGSGYVFVEQTDNPRILLLNYNHEITASAAFPLAGDIRYGARSGTEDIFFFITETEDKSFLSTVTSPGELKNTTELETSPYDFMPSTEGDLVLMFKDDDRYDFLLFDESLDAAEGPQVVSDRPPIIIRDYIYSHVSEGDDSFRVTKTDVYGREEASSISFSTRTSALSIFSSIDSDDGYSAKQTGNKPSAEHSVRFSGGMGNYFVTGPLSLFPAGDQRIRVSANVSYMTINNGAYVPGEGVADICFDTAGDLTKTNCYSHEQTEYPINDGRSRWRGTCNGHYYFTRDGMLYIVDDSGRIMFEAGVSRAPSDTAVLSDGSIIRNYSGALMHLSPDGSTLFENRYDGAGVQTVSYFEDREHYEVIMNIQGAVYENEPLADNVVMVNIEDSGRYGMRHLPMPETFRNRSGIVTRYQNTFLLTKKEKTGSGLRIYSFTTDSDFSRCETYTGTDIPGGSDLCGQIFVSENDAQVCVVIPEYKNSSLMKNTSCLLPLTVNSDGNCTHFPAEAGHIDHGYYPGVYSAAPHGHIYFSEYEKLPTGKTVNGQDLILPFYRGHLTDAVLKKQSELGYGVPYVDDRYLSVGEYVTPFSMCCGPGPAYYLKVTVADFENQPSSGIREISGTVSVGHSTGCEADGAAMVNDAPLLFARCSDTPFFVRFFKNGTPEAVYTAPALEQKFNPAHTVGIEDGIVFTGTRDGKLALYRCTFPR